MAMPSLGSPMVLIALKIRLVRNPTSCGQFHIMRKFRLCSKPHNAQYSSTKIKAIPVRTDNAMQEMLANSFLERPTVVRLQQRRGRYIGADCNIIAVALHIRGFIYAPFRHLVTRHSFRRELQADLRLYNQNTFSKI